jgi:antitoxin MazE
MEDVMVITYAKWGNSLAIRIPAAFAKDIGATEGAAAEMSVKGGCLVIAPVAVPTYELAELVSRITDENRHGEVGGHVAVGEEFA